MAMYQVNKNDNKSNFDATITELLGVAFSNCESPRVGSALG